MAKKQPKKPNIIGKAAMLKYKKVIDEYFINGFNGTQAYMAVYKNTKLPNTAATNFKRLSEIAEVKEYIDLKHKEAEEHAAITHEKMLERLKDILTLNATCVLGLSIEEIKALPDNIAQNIKKVKHKRNIRKNGKGKVIQEDEFIEVEFVSKEKAIDAINKHIGFYEKDNNQKAASIDCDKLSTDTLKELINAQIK